MAKEFITKDDADSSYMTPSKVYKLINSVKPDYTTVGSNGYVTLPGGITFEWGSVPALSGSRQLTIDLPKSLSYVFQGYVSVSNPSPGTTFEAYVNSISPTQIVLYKYAANECTLHWFVVGSV